MNNLVNHPIKDHGYTREYVMKPEMQEKISQKFKNLKNYGSAAVSQLSILNTLIIHYMVIEKTYF